MFSLAVGLGQVVARSLKDVGYAAEETGEAGVVTGVVWAGIVN